MTSPLTVEGGALAVPAAGPNGVRVYKGIPYAAPPLGVLRWRPPQPAAPWSGVRATDAFGPNSLQGVVFGDIDPTKPGVSEDCLYLNMERGVASPKSAAASSPSIAPRRGDPSGCIDCVTLERSDRPRRSRAVSPASGS